MSLKLKIAAYNEMVFDGLVDYCEIPAETGIEGIMPGHVNFISKVNAGKVKYKIGERIEEISIEKGFAEVSGDIVNILELNF